MKTNGSRNTSPRAIADGVQRDPLELDARAAAAGARAARKRARGWSRRRGPAAAAVSAVMSVTIPSRPELRRMRSTVNTIDSANSTSATTHAEPVSKRWKPRL